MQRASAPKEWGTYMNRSLCRTSVVVLLLVASGQIYAQSNDEKAWNAVWDRLERIIPKGDENNIVHVLDVPVPATWVQGGEALFDLQRIAGAIPDEQFTIDPSKMKSLLHQVYTSYVFDVDLPQASSADRAAFLAAENAYASAMKDYEAVLKDYLALWKAHVEDLKGMGQPITSQARLRFRGQHAGMFAGVQARLDDSTSDIQKFAPVAQYWVQAVRRLRDEALGAQSDMHDLYTYTGGTSTLELLKQKDCADPLGSAGWEEVVLSKSMTSEKTRQSKWNANGGWGGSFFGGSFVRGGGGAAGSSYQHWLNTDKDTIALRFCQLTPIDLGPGTWFVPSLLQAIDEGRIKLKSKSPMANVRPLGPKGAIPRMVKGAIVARRVAFSARIESARLTEFRKEFSASGGGRIGPFRIRGGGSKTEYSKESISEDGTYTRSTAFDVPVVIALITEPTRSALAESGDDKPDEKTGENVQ
jgi:hypothetical protein